MCRCSGLRLRRGLVARPLRQLAVAYRPHEVRHWEVVDRCPVVGLPLHVFISKLNLRARALAVYASRRGHPHTRNTRFRPLAKRYRVGFTHQVPLKGFKFCFLTSQSPFPELYRRTPMPTTKINGDAPRRRTRGFRPQVIVLQTATGIITARRRRLTLRAAKLGRPAVSCAASRRGCAVVRSRPPRVRSTM